MRIKARFEGSPAQSDCGMLESFLEKEIHAIQRKLFVRAALNLIFNLNGFRCDKTRNVALFNKYLIAVR